MFTVYAHRGLSSKAPENTLAAFEAAANVTGLKWIELDVAITKDEQLVIIHDDFLDRTTDMIGEITQLNYDEIKQASAGNWFNAKYAEEKLPTFDEVVALANKYKMNLNIELKGVTGKDGSVLSESMIKQVAEKLNTLNSNLDILLSSFNIVLLKLAQQLMPQYKRAVLFKAAAFTGDWRTLLDYCESTIVNIEDAKLSQARVRSIKNAGYELNVWTVNSKVRANQLSNWGVDGVFTDKADELVHLNSGFIAD